jgi:hypothetical protein
MRNFIHSLTRSNNTLVRDSAFKLHHFFDKSIADYRLDDTQKARLEHYLHSNDLTYTDFGNPLNAHGIVAFSFGDSDDVNKELAEVSVSLMKNNVFLDAHLQQEVAVHALDKVANINVVQNDAYQTTADVARVALEHSVGRNIIVVAQSWHAKRCIETCQQAGLNVVGLRTVQSFPKNDPQPWVRNPINWVLKESNRRFATGYEISKALQLA